VVFEEQVGAGAGVEGGWDLRLDCVLGFAIGDAVVFSLHTEEDADEDVGAVGWDGCEGGDVGEEKDAIDTGIGYVGELS